MASSDARTEAQILSGSAFSREVIDELRTEVGTIKQSDPTFQPCLAIIQVGDPDSTLFLKLKFKVADEIGISIKHVLLPTSATQKEIVKKLTILNQDSTIHGISFETPLNCANKIDTQLLIDMVAHEKDVDGLSTIDLGRLAMGDLDGPIPCIPRAAMNLIKRSGRAIAGLNAVVLGRSPSVGTPVAELLKFHDMTVTICNSTSRDIQNHVGRADVLVSCIGEPEFVKGSWIKEGATVIDCGMTTVPDPTGRSGHRIVGDISHQEVKYRAAFFAPVPRGVGPMNVAFLMENTVQRAKTALEKLNSDRWRVSITPILTQEPMSDLSLAQRHDLKDITALAEEIGLQPNELTLYGTHKAKLSVSILDRLARRQNGHYIVVTGINPTPFGEGKTTTAIGLVDSLIGHCQMNAVVCVKQPSQIKAFSVKGSAAGGGGSQIVPFDDFSVHLTGDIHAVTAANNLLAALIDARINHEKTASIKTLFEKIFPRKSENRLRRCTTADQRRLRKLNIDKTMPETLSDEEKEKFCRLDMNPSTITWKRVLDVPDRSLRAVTIGSSLKGNEDQQEGTSFMLPASSEIMSVLALCKNFPDFKSRVSNIVVAFSYAEEPITVDDLGATGALTLLMRDAIQPTMMQTLAGAPALIHAGPYSNMGHGCSSVIADEIALKLVGPNGFVVTEAGFGTDSGLEKFFNIKCHASGLSPDAVVLVVTVRAIKMHGGGPSLTHGVIAEEYKRENVEILRKGLPHLKQHVKNVIAFGVPVIVAINGFKTDSPTEWGLIREASLAAGAKRAIVTTNYTEGYAGAAALSEAVKAVCEEKPAGSQFRPLYEMTSTISSKIETVAKVMYGAAGIDLSDVAISKLELLERKGFGSLPICICKTGVSLTDDPSEKGVRKKFCIHVSDIMISAGAGFILAVAGQMPQIPGLPIRPLLFDVDIDPNTMTITELC